MTVLVVILARCGTNPSPPPVLTPGPPQAATSSPGATASGVPREIPTPSPAVASPSPSAASSSSASAAPSPSGPRPSPTPVSLPAATVPAAALYRSPSPATPGPPGSLLRFQPIAAPVGARAWAVLYRSTGLDGRRVPVSGIVLAPAGAAPRAGRPILAWGHGTVGLADACAPSHQGDGGELAYLAGPFLQRGFVVVATDYEGLGTAGIHPYLVGESEGRSILDIVKAARTIPAAGAGSDVVLLGHSQGGHAVLWAAQLASTYSPELRVVTTVAVAPAAGLVPIAEWIEGSTSSSVARLNGLLVAAAWHDVYGLPYRPGLTAAGAAIAARLPDACPDTPLAPPTQPFEAPVSAVPAFRDLLVRNTPGAARAEGPILVLQGTADEQIPASTTEDAVRSLCAAGDVVRLDVLPGVDHSGALVREAETIASWILARMGGVALGGTCGH